jgi:glucose 1-dehydrogenase/3-oxoacyl-[acyl-carrier protein] reductase
MPQAKLNGKVALVTGAGRGIGRVIALQLAAEGVSVALNYAHSEEGARRAAAEIESAGGQAAVIAADVAQLQQVEGMVAKVIQRFGQLDILVNNSAIDPRKPFLDVTEDFWDLVIDTNLKGTFFCSQTAAREMMRVGKGRIINISSVHAQATMNHYAVYAASKGGMNALTRQLALDLAPFKITVNAIAPGCVQVEKSTYDPASRGQEIPCGRVGHPRDISAAVAFLASDETDWLTGQVITIDGGSTTRLFLDLATLPSPPR